MQPAMAREKRNASDDFRIFIRYLICGDAVSKMNFVFGPIRFSWTAAFGRHRSTTDRPQPTRSGLKRYYAGRIGNYSDTALIRSIGFEDYRFLVGLYVRQLLVLSLGLRVRLLGKYHSRE
jgi:hypothetical protein